MSTNFSKGGRAISPFLYLNHMKYSSLLFVLLAFRLFGQQVTFTHVSQFPFQNFETIQSGDTVNIFAEDHWTYPVHVDLNGYQNGTLNFRIVDLDGNACYADQFRVYVIPDPNFESSCFSPNGLNYLSPEFNNVNIEGGDTVIIQSEGYMQCGGCNQFRYFVELNQVKLDSFDLRICQSQASLNEYTRDSFSIFPNPTSDEISWRSDLIFTHYSIYDITGQLVESNNILNSNKIEILKFSEGIYFLELLGPGGAFVHQRFRIKHY